MRVYNSFDEIRAEVREATPEVVYKYRSWTDPYHKNMLLQRQVWLAHPNTLNDPHDLRSPITFDVQEIESAEFYQKLFDSAPQYNPHLTTEEEYHTACKQQLDLIRQDPNEHFQSTYANWLTGSHYDQYGLFSTSLNGLDNTMWAHYGDNHQGYCIGFNTLALAESMNCGFGFVEYSDNALPFSFINPHDDNELYVKATNWSYEQEFRFITLRIGERERAHNFDEGIISEIILGLNISAEHEHEILEYMAGNHPNIPVYKATRMAGAFGFSKTKLN